MPVPFTPVPEALSPAQSPALFEITRTRAYLNNASIGPLSRPVLAALTAFQHDIRDNGRNNYPDWCDHVDGPVKQRIASLIGAHRDEIAFVKNTTEGLITVANGLDWREATMSSSPISNIPPMSIAGCDWRASGSKPASSEAGAGASPSMTMLPPSMAGRG